MHSASSQITSDPADAAALAAAISAIGQPEFPAALLGFVESCCAFDSALIVLYSARRRPDVLLDCLSHARRENSAQRYVEGAYLLDPFYARARDIAAPALLRMRDIAPPGFDASEYFVTYYKQSNVVDELNILVPVDDGRVFAVAIERSSLREPFANRDIAAGTACLPVVAALVGRHVADPGTNLPADSDDREHKRLEALLRNFGADVLTPRECEVVQLMLKGYAAAAIAALLGVSVETVRVHRRNLYEKLGISSLAELFALALKAIHTRDAA